MAFVIVMEEMGSMGRSTGRAYLLADNGGQSYGPEDLPAARSIEKARQFPSRDAADEIGRDIPNSYLVELDEQDCPVRLHRRKRWLGWGEQALGGEWPADIQRGIDFIHDLMG